MQNKSNTQLGKSITYSYVQNRELFFASAADSARMQKEGIPHAADAWDAKPHYHADKFKPPKGPKLPDLGSQTSTLRLYYFHMLFNSKNILISIVMEVSRLFEYMILKIAGKQVFFQL